MTIWINWWGPRTLAAAERISGGTSPSGRSADYIPCNSAVGASAQATYSPAQANGDGTEEFYVYDALGRLTDEGDQARHDAFSYWANGRPSEMATFIATPSGGSSLATRYTTTHATAFEKLFTAYSVTGDLMGSQTANIPSTFASFASFTESAAYTQDGYLATTVASFADWSGSVVSGTQYNADGTIGARTFGDVAATNVVKNYDSSGALTFYHLTRNAGRFANGGFVNTVSPAPDGTTTQADLMTLVIGRDAVGNPQSISDISTGTWQNA